MLLEDRGVAVLHIYKHRCVRNTLNLTRRLHPTAEGVAVQFYQLFLTEFLLDVSLVSLIYRIRLRHVSKTLTGFVLLLFAAMTPIYLGQFYFSFFVEFPIALLLSFFGFLLVYRLASIGGLESSLTLKLKREGGGSITSLIRNTDVFFAVCLAVVVPSLATLFLSTNLILSVRLLLIALICLVYFVLSVRYVFNRFGPVERLLENALWGLFYFSFLFSILLFCILFLGIFDLTGDYALGATLAGLVLIIPVTVNAYYIARVSRGTVVQSPRIAIIIVKYRWRHLLVATSLILILADFPLAYWIYTNLSDVPLFTWMLGLVFYLAQVIRTTKAETTRLSIDFGLLTEAEVKSLSDKLRGFSLGFSVAKRERRSRKLLAMGEDSSRSPYWWIKPFRPIAVVLILLALLMDAIGQFTLGWVVFSGAILLLIAWFFCGLWIASRERR